MNSEQIIEEYKQDSQIDDTELDKESLRTIELHSKYLSLFSDTTSNIKKLRIHRRKLKNTLREYYKGNLNNPEDLEKIGREPYPHTILKNELDDYVESDDDIVKIDNKLATLEEKEKLLEHIIKAINNRGFQIKNAIDWHRFTNGLN